MVTPLELIDRENKVYPGRVPKDIELLIRRIVIELGSGPKRWSDLIDNAEIKKLITSEHQLSRALDELMERGTIKQEKITHKNRPYSLCEKTRPLATLMMLNPFQSYELTTLYPSDKEAFFEDVDRVLTTISDLDPSVRPYAEEWFRDEYCSIMLNYYRRIHENEMKDRKDEG